MRKWFKTLTSSPRGFAADGRVLGLGLATAMARQARAAEVDSVEVDSVEQYLRKQPVADHKVDATL